MKKPTAKIEPDGGDSEALWLVIERDDEDIATRFPIEQDEVEAIATACEEWLEQESQRVMKETTN